MSHFVICGYGGIGAACAAALTARDDNVSLITRQSLNISEGIKSYTFDQLEALLSSQCPDVVINTLGILHEAEHTPEKNINQVTQDWLFRSIQINVLPTIQIAQALTKVMTRQSSIKLITLSARVGSISDNHMGGWYSYRLSKAALNMCVKNLGIEWKRTYPLSSIIAYHPGTVDTNLSKPFQANVPADKLFSTTKAAEYLLAVVDKLTPDKSGHLIDWKNEIVAP